LYVFVQNLSNDNFTSVLETSKKIVKGAVFFLLRTNRTNTKKAIFAGGFSYCCYSKFISKIVAIMLLITNYENIAN
jgi:hypothetical protein